MGHPEPTVRYGAFSALRVHDPKAMDKLIAGQPEGGMLIWRPKTGWEDVPAADLPAEHIHRPAAPPAAAERARPRTDRRSSRVTAAGRIACGS